jgi:hypothetical protein
MTLRNIGNLPKIPEGFIGIVLSVIN